MISPLPFILLYFLTNTTLYVHYPPRVLHGKVCFDTLSSFDQCEYMKTEIINNNTSALSYNMNEEQKTSAFFKVLFYYPNHTIFDTNWIQKKIANNTSSNDETTKCYISFIFIIIFFISMTLGLSLLGIVYYHYRL